jgi:hypothetical protein
MERAAFSTCGKLCHRFAIAVLKMRLAQAGYPGVVFYQEKLSKAHNSHPK